MSGDWQNAATVVVELVLVLAVIGLAAYQVVHDPTGDVTKGLIGAITVAFGSVVTHLFSQKQN